MIFLVDLFENRWIKCFSHYAANSNKSSFKPELVSHCIVQYIMPKKQSAGAKAREICTQYADEFMITPRGNLYGSVCSVLVKYEKKIF